MFRIVRLQHGLIGVQHAKRRNLVTLAFDSSNDFANETATHTVRFNENEGAL
jgi:hypothetical protein